MRTKAKENRNVTVTRVQGYHERENYTGYDMEQYAFEGFGENKYFTSDRFIRLDRNFRRPDGKPLTGFGLEIEMECTYIRDTTVLADVMKKIIFVLFPAGLFKMQRDGSLMDDEDEGVSVECITQVMTKAFIRNHYRDFKAMYNVYFPSFGMSCSDTGNCGMHVNISNAVFGKTEKQQITAIRKLHYFINHNFRLACRLFERNTSYTDFCGEMYADKDYCKTMDIVGGDHYVCMNYSHFDVGRIELRLVGGQSDFYEFQRTMETVFFLCDRVKSISWDDIDNFTKVFKGCNQYVYRRLVDCRWYSNVLTDEIMAEIKNNMVTEDFDIR